MEQCTGLPEVEIELKNKDFNPIEKAQEILDKSGANIVHKKQSRAFYNPNNDTIFLPLKEQFTTEEEYYRTALHELGHWTGHETRLNRQSDSFGGESYAREELVAEITSFLVGTQCGLGHEPHQNNIAYIKEWAGKIRDNSSFLYNAVKEADKAAKLILGKELDLIKNKNNENKMENINNDTKLINLIDSIGSNITDEIKKKLEKEEQSFLTRQYIVITEPFFEEYVYDSTGKSIKDYGIMYDDAHNMHYLVDNAKYTIKDLPNGMEKNIEKATVNLERYYLNFYINELTIKLGKEKTEALGLMYDEDRELYYCKPEERYKFLPYISVYKSIPEQDRHYLDLSEKEKNELFCYNLSYDHQLKKSFIHKDLKHIYEDYLITTRNQQHQLNLNNSIVYIDVPIHEKEEAKKLGAKWDKNNQCWFVHADKDLSLFNKWEKLDEKDLVARKEQMQQNKNKVMDKQEEKYILAVPYMARYEAKALGAEWDKDNKVWYCMESEKEKFSKWDIKNTKNKVKVDMSLPASEEFLLKIKEMGVTENNIIADGEKHRISVDGDKGKEQSGFYVFHTDGVANGYFMNNRTGEEIKWVSKSSEIISAEKKAELQAMAVQKRQERQNEENIAREKAENKLQDIYSQSTPAKDNSYLDKKNILASNDLKTTKYNDLMVPLYDIDRQLKSAQYIKSDGSKIFAKDCNSQGNFHIINKEFDKLNNCNTVVISEGYATANTVHEALRSNKESDIPVIASMSAKNIEKVIEVINNKYQEEGYPLKNIIICADNDKSKNQNVGLILLKK